MSILLAAVVVAAVLLACFVGYILGLTVAELRAQKPVSLMRPERKPAPEPEENPHPIGSDEFWTWQPAK